MIHHKYIHLQKSSSNLPIPFQIPSHVSNQTRKIRQEIESKLCNYVATSEEMQNREYNPVPNKGSFYKKQCYQVLTPTRLHYSGPEGQTSAPQFKASHRS